MYLKLILEQPDVGQPGAGQAETIVIQPMVVVKPSRLVGYTLQQVRRDDTSSYSGTVRSEPCDCFASADHAAWRRQAVGDRVSYQLVHRTVAERRHDHFLCLAHA
jgi:hypothetical protein